VPDRSVPRLGDLALVAGGGSVGTALRFALSTAVPPSAAPLAILAINVAGAFALGALLEAVAHRPGPASTRLRLLLGTGVLGGFTTYSTLADDTAQLLDLGRWTAGSGYALLSVVLGLVAVVLGLWVAAATRPRTRPESLPDAR